MFRLLRDGKLLAASAVMMGTMIGVGIYGVPFVFAKAGFLLGAAWLIGLAAIMGTFYLLFAELTLSTQGNHQLAGYAHIWLGAWGRRAMTLVNVVGIYGALLAYIIVFGQFGHTLLAPLISVDAAMLGIGFAIVWSLLWLARLRTIANIELWLMALYGAVIVVIGSLSASQIHLVHLTGWVSEAWWLPYGVLIFALGGATAIPIQRRLLNRKEILLRPAIIGAVAGVTVIYLIFAFIVVGVSGEATSPEALAGLAGAVGSSVILIGAFLGLLTIATSYLGLGAALWEMFHLDYHLRPGTAWFLVAFPPLLFFGAGFRNFIDVIGLVGAVAGGAQGVLLLGAFLRMRRVRLRQPEFRSRFPRILIWGMMLVFAAGVVHALFIR